MNAQTSLNLKPNSRSARSRRERDSAARIAELEALQRIGRAMNSTLDEKQILHLLIREAVALTPATCGCVVLQDKWSDHRLIQAWYGYTLQEAQNLENIDRFPRRGIVNRVFATGQIAVIDDVCQAPDYLEAVPTTRSELTVPILYGQEIVGVIDLESPDLAAFHSDSQRFVLAIAEQAAMAIGNARRYADQVERENAVSRRNEQLRNLLEISRTLRSEHALEDLLDMVVYAIPATAGFNIALLSLVEDDPPMLRRVAAAGITLAELMALKQVRQPLEAFEKLLQEKYRISHSYFFPHQEQEEWDKDGYSYTVLKDIGTWQEGDWHPEDMLLVPLKDSKGNLLGLLSVDDPQDNRIPTSETVETLELYAHEVALAIENARLLNETRQHVEELEHLRQVGLQVASSLSLTTVLETIVASALQLVPASDVRIYLYDQQTGCFECGTHKSRGDHFSRPMAPPRKDGFTAQVAQKGEIVVINDAPNHDLYNRPESREWGVRAIAGFPLKRAGEILGVMDVSFFHEHTFSQKELDLLSMLANQAAVTIDHARLYEHAKRRATHLEALWHIDQQLASILDFDELLDQVVKIIHNYFNHDYIHIYLLDKASSQLVLRAQSGPDNPSWTGTGYRVSLDQPDCVVSWVATHNKSLLVEDLEKNVHYRASCPIQNSKSELAIPLYIGDQIAGVLDLHDGRINGLNQEDLSIIQSLGAQLSVALENARLYDELELRVQKRTEELAEALQRQALEADKTSAIVESISDAVIVFDPEGTVILANPGTARVLGLSPRLWIRRRLSDSPLPDLPDPEREMMDAVFSVTRFARQALSNDQDLVNKTFEAASRVIAASFASVALREQEPAHTVAVFRDVTKEAMVDRMKSEFIAMAAHELRTPMTAIKGYTSALSTGMAGSVNEMQQRFLEIVESNANRLMTLVNDLLDISKIENEGLKLNLEPVSLSDLVAEAAISLQKQIEAKGQSFSVDVPRDLPEATADRNRMIQVVTNLLSNAHKYTPQGGRLAVRGRHLDGRLILELQDSGIGIAPQDQERLFTRFFRADNAVSTQEGGTGLGLAICREIVKQHGGDIQVESELGQGSTFSVILPAKSTTGSYIG